MVEQVIETSLDHASPRSSQCIIIIILRSFQTSVIFAWVATRAYIYSHTKSKGRKWASVEIINFQNKWKHEKGDNKVYEYANIDKSKTKRGKDRIIIIYNSKSTYNENK